MKVFISWSGSLSKQIAECIKKWLPCIVQSADIFFSSDDIEKGENWDSKISEALAESSYGIICLTSENVLAPWVNFEAGAIAKALNSNVATLMINISPSEIKGPLSRYQATKIEREDFFQLISSINSKSDKPISDDVLKNTFNGLWSGIEREIKSIVSSAKTLNRASQKVQNNSDAIEEILLLLRKQNTVLSSPEQILPEEYIAYVAERLIRSKNNIRNDDLLYQIIEYLSWVATCAEDNTSLRSAIRQLRMNEFLEQIEQYIRETKRSKRVLFDIKEIRTRFERFITESE